MNDAIDFKAHRRALAKERERAAREWQPRATWYDADKVLAGENKIG